MKLLLSSSLVNASQYICELISDIECVENILFNLAIIIVLSFSDTFIGLAILLLSITWLFLVKQSAFKTWGTSQSYFVGICHGFAAVCVLLLVYNVVYFEIQHVTTSTEGSIAFIYVTANGSYICPRKDQGEVTSTRMEIWLVFLASYSLCLMLCNAVVNSKLDARHEVCWPQGTYMYYNYNSEYYTAVKGAVKLYLNHTPVSSGMFPVFAFHHDQCGLQCTFIAHSDVITFYFLINK